MMKNVSLYTSKLFVIKKIISYLFLNIVLFFTFYLAIFEMAYASELALYLLLGKFLLLTAFAIYILKSKNIKIWALIWLFLSAFIAALAALNSNPDNLPRNKIISFLLIGIMLNLSIRTIRKSN